MTDTPRTRAELLTIFGDGQAANSITPQDMRDFVVSMPNPSLAAGRFVGQLSLMPISVPGDQSSVYVPIDQSPTELYDPQGWWQFDDDYPSPDWYGETVPAGAWALLPEGIYMVRGTAQWDTNTTGFRAYRPLDNCDNRSLTPGLDPWAWDPYYTLYQYDTPRNAANLSVIAGTLRHSEHSVIRVPRATAPVAFAHLVYQNSGTTRQLLDVDMSILQITDRVG